MEHTIMEFAAAAAVAVLIWAAIEAAKQRATEEPIPVRVDEDSGRHDRR